MADDNPMSEMGLIALLRFMLSPGDATRVQKEMQDAINRGTHPAQAEANIGSMEKAFTRMGNTVRRVAEYMIARELIRGVAAFVGEMFKLGGDTIETWNKFGTTFGDNTAKVDTFIAKYGTMMGLSTNMAREYAATSGAILQGMGVTTAASADMTMQVLRMAGDITSFTNKSIDQTFGAIRSRITGEMEPLRNLGYVITEADVKQQQAKMSAQGHADAMTQAGKAAAVLTLLEQRLGVASGDLARTKDSLANKSRRIGAEWENLKIKIAVSLLPAFGYFVDAVDKNKDAMDGLATVIGGTLRWSIIGLLNLLGAGITAILTFNAAMAETAKLGISIREFFGLDASKYRKELAETEKRMESLRQAGNATLAAIRGLMNPNADLGKATGGVTPVKPTAPSDPHALDKEVAALAELAKHTSTRAKALTELTKLETAAKAAVDSHSGSIEHQAEAWKRLQAIQAAINAPLPGEYEQQIKQAKELTLAASTRIEGLQRLDTIEEKLREDYAKAGATAEERAAIERQLGEVQDARYDIQVRLSEEGLKNDSTRQEAQTALIGLEEELIGKLQDGNLAYDERVKLVEKLASVQSALASIDPAKALMASIRTAITANIRGGQSLRDVIKMIGNDATIVTNLIGAMTKGGARAALKDLAQEAKGNALMDAARSLSELGKGWAASANPFTASQAAAHFTAAKTLAASAAKWGLAAAGMGGIAGIGDSGGSDAAGGTGSTGTSQAATTQSVGPHVVIMVDGFDADKPRHQEKLWEGVKQAEERFGWTFEVVPRGN